MMEFAIFARGHSEGAAEQAALFGKVQEPGFQGDFQNAAVALNERLACMPDAKVVAKLHKDSSGHFEATSARKVRTVLWPAEIKPSTWLRTRQTN
jgi:hypothetical protein